MIMFISYIIVFSIISGLALTKPLPEKVSNASNSDDHSLEQAFRKAEIILNRYFYLIKSDTDQVVHAMLTIILNNPTSFSFVPHRALDIALKSVAQKLGQDDADTLTKPLVLAIERNALNKSQQPSSSAYQLTDDVKIQIEDALDKFFDDQENTSYM